MKRIATILFLAWMTAHLQAQTLNESLSFNTNFTMGIPLPDSDISPLSLLVSAEYKLHPRFSAGLGTGISKYDQLMLPVFATLHWQLSRQHRLTPVLACNIGHAFAPQKDVSGGFYMMPSIGMRYKLKGSQSLSVAIGYELQEYNQLVSYETKNLLTQYVENNSNHALTASIGFSF